MANLFFVKQDNPSKNDEQFLTEALQEYGRREIGGKSPEKIGVFLRASKRKTVGGVIGRMILGGLYISHLWVSEELRGQGYGSQLLKSIESEAQVRGCSKVILDTLNSKSVPFYLKNGYQILAELPDFIAGFNKYYFIKNLMIT
jgi:GNAT superfamily N-acetyltransferase